MSRSKVRCRICQTISAPLDKATILGKYEIHYYSCTGCGFIQTEVPYWLEEAYSSAIARSDVGLIGRNIKLSVFCSVFIPLFFNSKARFLDYGGGNGMFVRMMRDRGYDFYWQDKFSANLFAEGFEVTDGKYALLTAFEVFEHLPDPLPEIESMLNLSGTIIFTTRLLPRWRINPDEWWYFAPDTGQHVSFYSRESLRLIAKRFNVHFSTNGISLHLLSRKKIPGVVLKALSSSPLASLLSTIVNLGRKSLLSQDYYRLTGRFLEK